MSLIALSNLNEGFMPRPFTRCPSRPTSGKAKPHFVARKVNAALRILNNTFRICACSVWYRVFLDFLFLQFAFLSIVLSARPFTFSFLFYPTVQAHCAVPCRTLPLIQ